MNCDVFSKKANSHYENVKSITILTDSGEAQILSGHAEFYSLIKGKITILKEGLEKEELETTEGFCRVDAGSNTVIILY